MARAGSEYVSHGVPARVANPFQTFQHVVVRLVCFIGFLAGRNEPFHQGHRWHEPFEMQESAIFVHVARKFIHVPALWWHDDEIHFHSIVAKLEWKPRNYGERRAWDTRERKSMTKNQSFRRTCCRTAVKKSERQRRTKYIARVYSRWWKSSPLVSSFAIASEGGGRCAAAIRVGGCKQMMAAAMNDTNEEAPARWERGLLDIQILNRVTCHHLTPTVSAARSHKNHNTKLTQQHCTKPRRQDNDDSTSK
jgi:hypothetical protein